MKKNIALLIVIWFVILFVSWCTKTVEEKKQPFYIETQRVDGFVQQVVLTKPGKVVGTQEIVVTSQVSGRIGKIFKREGNRVWWWQPIISINDSIANYGLQVQRAKNNFDRSMLQYSQSTTNLDKSINDAQTTLDVAKNTYEVTQATTEQNIKRANLDYTMSSIQIENLWIQFVVEKKSLMNNLDAILHQVDTYLWITEKYQTYNDNYEIYLWVRNNAQKAQTENDLRLLYQKKTLLNNLTGDKNSDIDQLSAATKVMSEIYDLAQMVLEWTRQVLLDTIVSISLSQVQVDWYKASIDVLKSALQWSYVWFTVYNKQILSMKKQNDTWWVAVSDEQASINYNTALINSQNAVFNSEIWVKNAMSLYNTMINTKDEQLWLLENGVIDSQIWYQDALTRFNKLSVRAPIQWVISNIMVDEWQEVSPGTHLFTIINNKSQLVNIFVDVDELDLIDLEQEAKIHYYDKLYSGQIVAVSSVAEKNGLYKVIVALQTGVDLIGGIATVDINSKVWNPLLPVNVVSVLAENTGFISVFKWTGLIQYMVRLGTVWSDRIEILSNLPAWLEIVTNDVSNFDYRRYNLEIKN